LTGEKFANSAADASSAPRDKSYSSVQLNTHTIPPLMHKAST
jgi:hypothetical protein